ncbi:DUF4265 domain-containing protein [Chitinophaga sp. B61]|uniref:DUF4265 domain-containing protein n=1 Tax=Chitinophaga rhizophila TaxID=2866212 RepID=A0ABS7GIM4_9BACT|nr:DUF4265 domain-containing protein [Chitinophaga rhizophila]
MIDKTIMDTTIHDLEKLGCGLETIRERHIIGVNIPKEMDYIPVRKYLQAGCSANKWDYEESCLCHTYDVA